MSDIVIIGGGAAGMIAAIAAARSGKGENDSIILLEKNEKLGKKLFITGKGRCNVTNACDTEKLFDNVMEHQKFLYSAIYGFDNQAVMNFFEEAGCALKIERGQRVFPESDHSSDIIRVLEREMKKLGVEVLLDTEVKKIKVLPLADEPSKSNQDEINDKYSKKKSAKKKLKCTSQIEGVEIYNTYKKKSSYLKADKLIIATGGCSYVLTGSTGDGYRFAKSLGHSVVKTRPSLVPFSIKEKWCYELQGLSLKNVKATVTVNGEEIYSDFGEMLFTHYGVSGPLILSASSFYVHHLDKIKEDDYNNIEAKLYIDLKPALTHEQLDKRVLREFDDNKNKQFKNVINSLFPSKLVPIMPTLADINPDKQVNEVTKEERENFVNIIKNLELTITGLRDYNEAIITRGGIATNEISPSTMESKLVKNLYFAGEVIDLDALTGGFNLQIAWSTGYLAGKSAAER
jgi:hypothetical protein